MSETFLQIQNVEKIFQIGEEYLQALDNVSLNINKNEFISIVGHSGCGKSTLIRMIAGLETPTNGKIMLNEDEITKPSIDVGMVFQEARLFPWLSVLKNIEFGITEEKISSKEKKERAKKMIDLVGLTGFEKAIPKQLSGGMQQRVNIARSLVNTPKILLLDEPFSALDAFTRMTMQNELYKIWQKEKNTMILVTHDIDEAIFLSTKIVIMSERPGKIKEVISVNLSDHQDRTSGEFQEIRLKILKSLFGSDVELEYYI